MPDRKISAETPLSAPQDLSKMRVPLFHLDGTPNDAVMTLEQVLLSPKAIDINTGSIASSAIGLRIQQTWTGTGTYNAPLLVDIPTDSGPANAASKLLDLQVGGVTAVASAKRGTIHFPVTFSSTLAIPAPGIGNYYGTLGLYGDGGNIVAAVGAGVVTATSVTGGFGINNDVYLRRTAADRLALQRTTNPQRFEVYRTWSAADNFERGVISWYDSSSDLGAATTPGTLRIGTEKGSVGGTARPVSIITDGVERIGIAANSVTTVTFDTALVSNGFLVKGTNGTTYCTVGGAGISTQGQLAEISTVSGTTGRLNIGAGQMHLTHTAGNVSIISTFGSLSIRPGGLATVNRAELCATILVLQPPRHRLPHLTLV